MPWNIRQATGGVHVFTATGEAGAAQLRQLRASIAELGDGAQRVVVDLTLAPRIASGGIDALAGVRLRVHGRGGTLAVAGGSGVRRAVAAYRIERALILETTAGRAVRAVLEKPSASDHGVCDWCGAPVSPESGVEATIRDSSAELAAGPEPELPEGIRLVRACTDQHAQALTNHYAQRPYTEAELWAHRLDRLDRLDGPADDAGAGARRGRATDLTPDQLRAAIAWRSGGSAE